MLSILTSLILSAGLVQAHDTKSSCEEQAFEKAVNYCQKLYHPRSQSFQICKLGAAHTYEALLTEEPTTNREVCKPYFLRQCDSGRKIMLAHYNHCPGMGI